ncbi:MAG: HesA/MoeB/ThiF family protein [Bacteroidetes bacterium]|nr:HesA/MoeB/ThiF family protein [Bacteroidota bacterium]
MDFERYQRQISHPKIGVNGQQQLLDAKVLVVGAGGLGCPVMQYLTAAGVGKIGVVDGDVVSKSNLPRQILFTELDLGKLKVSCAEKYLKWLNADIEVVPFPVFMNNKNAFNILSDYDVIVDCTDDFATRYLLNDACVLLEKPLVYGAIYLDQGQVAVFNCKLENKFSSNYRDIYPNPPTKNEVPTCEELGVMGVLPGTIGLFQANEVLKVITKAENILADKFLVFNMSTYSSNTFDVIKNSSTIIPSSQSEFEKFDYISFCGRVAMEPANSI